MRTSVVKGVVAFLAVLAVGALAVAEASAEVNAMAGKSKITYTKREAVPVGDAPGHVITLSEATGTNENTGTWAFMEGAETFSRSSADLTKGNGAHSGYFILSKGADLAVSKYTGTIRTVLSPEGKPLTTLSGEWKWVKCAGAFEGCTGQGVYEGKAISENEVLVEYRGVLVQ